MADFFKTLPEADAQARKSSKSDGAARYVFAVNNPSAPDNQFRVDALPASQSGERSLSKWTDGKQEFIAQTSSGKPEPRTTLTPAQVEQQRKAGAANPYQTHEQTEAQRLGKPDQRVLTPAEIEQKRLQDAANPRPDPNRHPAQSDEQRRSEQTRHGKTVRDEDDL